MRDTVASGGCQYGVSTILMAQAFPNCRFFGFDYHQLSIQWARRRAGDGGVSDRVCFETVSAKDIPGDAYDLITMFDCLHDMGDPVGVARHMRTAITNDRNLDNCQPFAEDRVEEQFKPVRLIYCASVLLCTAGAIERRAIWCSEGGQAGEKHIPRDRRPGGRVYPFPQGHSDAY